MKHILALLVLAGCTATSHQNSPVEQHRETAVACTATAGSVYGPDECLVDTDCPVVDQACACAGTTFEHGLETRNLCVTAGCHVDADCGTGGLCSPSVGNCGNGFFGIQDFECRTPDDTCGADVDCVQNGEMGSCSFLPEVGHWACTFTACAG
jgi:hypothetical protein